MKAVVNGVTVEGTPQEIIEYQRIQAEKAEHKPFKNPTSNADWFKHLPKVVSTEAIKRCEGTCFCTGACEGRSAVSQQKWSNDYNNVTENRFKDLICTNG